MTRVLYGAWELPILQNRVHRTHEKTMIYTCGDIRIIEGKKSIDL
jgi:hypothetical protein